MSRSVSATKIYKVLHPSNDTGPLRHEPMKSQNLFYGPKVGHCTGLPFEAHLKELVGNHPNQNEFPALHQPPKASPSPIEEDLMLKTLRSPTWKPGAEHTTSEMDMPLTQPEGKDVDPGSTYSPSQWKWMAPLQWAIRGSTVLASLHVLDGWGSI